IIEIKLEIDLIVVANSVVAMCLANLTIDFKNWSSDIVISLTVKC
ncbi:unnamed protein product, partial [Rotaria sp. Silwood2]